MKKLTSFEKDLRQALMSKSTTVFSQELHGETLAWVEYEGRKVEVAIDPMRGGIIECVVHELIHAVYEKKLAEWGDLEEAIVIAVEKEMMDLINSSRRRVKWWRDAIGSKLEHGEGS